MTSWKTYFLKIFYYHIYLGEGGIFFNLFNFFYFPRNLIFTFFIFFMERGKVGTLSRLWNQFIKFRLTFPGRKISSLKNLTHFHFFFFPHIKFIKFFRHLSRWGHSPSFLHFAPRHTYFRMFPNDYYETNNLFY